MEEPTFRRARAADSRIALPPAPRAPRIATALALAALTLAAGAATSASAGSGGAGFDPSAGGSGGGGNGETAIASGECAAARFGSRTLARGDCGDDVRTLNWILKSKDYSGVVLADAFEGTTESAVREFERTAAIGVDGVVESETFAAIVRSMPAQLATWYGPGFFGNETACGETLSRRTVGVAHRTLPCGSKVVVRYKGRFLRTRVIDRGPYSNGAQWDLTQRAARLLGFETTDEVRVAKLARTR